MKPRSYLPFAIMAFAATMALIMWPFTKKIAAAPPQAADQWLLRTGDIDGRPSIIRIDASAETRIQSPLYSTRSTITVRLRQPDDRGFPSPSELDSLAAIEDGVIATFNADSKGILVAVVTRDSKRVFVLYTSDSIVTSARFRALAEKYSSHHMEIAHEHDPTRDEYRRLSRSSAQASAAATLDSTILTGFQPEDLQVVEQLVKAGSDLSLRHPVDHYLYFPSEAKARAAASRLQSLEFSVEVRPPTPGYSDWLLLASQEVFVRSDSLGKAISDLRGFASRNGGMYDGWEAQVMRPTH